MTRAFGGCHFGAHRKRCFLCPLGGDDAPPHTACNRSQALILASKSKLRSDLNYETALIFLYV